MKIKKSIIVLPMFALLLSGCVGTQNYAESEYIIETNWGEKEEFRILQLGDIHQSQSDLHEDHFMVMDRTIEASKPDMIVLNGDIFTYADKHVVKKVFQYFDNKNIPWTFTFGNHDDQGYYSDNYIQRLLGGQIKGTQYKNVLFKNLEDDDVTGRSNFVINIKSGEEVKYQVYCLDSNNYNFDTMEYDIVKQDQIDWYARMVDYSKTNYGNVKSSMYLHIAPPEAVIDWEKMDAEHCIIGDMQEGLGSPSEDLHFVQKVLDLGLTQSIHANHDHANDAVFKYKEGGKEIYFAYGVHATNRIYNDKDGVKFGGQLLKINKTDTSKLVFENYYVSYEAEGFTMTSTEGGAK